MGEVYRGVDTRLGRAVALKVISQRLVGDEGSRRRFETEARAASALNQPAIVTIYDIGVKRSRPLPAWGRSRLPGSGWTTPAIS